MTVSDTNKDEEEFYCRFYNLIIQDGIIKIQMVYPISNCDEANCFGPLLPNFNGKP